MTGQTGDDPIFQGAADFDLELIESRTLDGRIVTEVTSSGHTAKRVVFTRKPLQCSTITQPPRNDHSIRG